MLLVPETSIREGLLIAKREANSSLLQAEFNEQIIAAVYNLGKKYNIDMEHAEYVKKTSLFLFDSALISGLKLPGLFSSYCRDMYREFLKLSYGS